MLPGSSGPGRWSSCGSIPRVTVIGPRKGRPFLDGMARSLVDTGDVDFSLFEQDVPANTPPVPAHVHDVFDEAFYVLEGEVWVTLGHVDERLAEGAFALVRRGVRHRFWNPTEVNARMLVIGHPRVQLLVEEVAPLVRRGDIDAVVAAFARYESRIVD